MEQCDTIFKNLLFVNKHTSMQLKKWHGGRGKCDWHDGFRDWWLGGWGMSRTGVLVMRLVTLVTLFSLLVSKFCLCLDEYSWRHKLASNVVLQGRYKTLHRRYKDVTRTLHRRYTDVTRTLLPNIDQIWQNMIKTINNLNKQIYILSRNVIFQKSKKQRQQPRQGFGVGRGGSIGV